MKFCEECGHKLSEEEVFCENCGTPVKEYSNEQTKEVMENHIDKTEESFRSISSDQETEQQPKKRIEKAPDLKKKKPNKRLPLLIILLLLIGCAIFWGVNRFVTSDDNNANNGNVVESSTSIISEDIESTESSTSTETTEESDNFDPERIEEIANSSVGRLSNLTGAYVMPVGEELHAYSNNASQSIKAASVIKLFILQYYYEMLATGNIDSNASYTLVESDKVGGTGILQNYDAGQTFSLEQLARYMIVESDNTAGNILINQLGGMNRINTYLIECGYTATTLERYFVDEEALSNGYDNYTSAYDVAMLLDDLYKRELISSNYDAEMLALLRDNTNHTKIPAKIGSEVTIYNKTGEYTAYGIQNDACILATDDASYIVVVLSQDGNEEQQISAMNQFGLDLYNELLKGE